MFETINKKSITIVALILAFAFVYSYTSGSASTTGQPIVRNVVLTGGNNLAGNNTNHTECQGLACVTVSGAGNNTCRTNRDCINIAKANKTRVVNMTHTECAVYPNGVGFCQIVAGPGNNQCGMLNNGYADCNKLDCVPGGSNSTNGTCSMVAMVAGIGADNCGPINSTC